MVGNGTEMEGFAMESHNPKGQSEFGDVWRIDAKIHVGYIASRTKMVLYLAS
jgi:hypothetical protein